MPKISIIVPVYNAEKYLNQCIDSILEQTLKDFELILINDGSQDNSGKICEEYKERDSRIIVIHKVNGGTSEARNYGLSIARGEYIGFVDSDDYIDKDMYEKLFSAITKFDVSISMCGRYDVYDDIKVKKSFYNNRINLISKKEGIRNILIWNKMDSSFCDKLFQRKLFDNVKFPTGRYYEDIYLIGKLIISSENIIHIGESKYFYRHRKNSRSTGQFSLDSLELIDSANKLIKIAQVNYPDLKREMDCFYFSNLILIMKLMEDNNKDNSGFIDHYNNIGRSLHKNLMKILCNNYIIYQNKVLLILICTKLYKPLKQIKNLIR